MSNWETVQICNRCLYPATHPLGIVLDEEGICSGCRVHEEKDTLDWEWRWQLLEKLVQPYRLNSGKNYDCIVPVTGAHDSYYIVHLVKHKLGLNPLLVTYNKYFNTPLGIRNLANLRICFDCDILIQNVNPISVKKITQTSIRELGSIYWHCLAGQTVFPVQTAVRYKVPLIVWGAHQGLEQVGMFSHEHEVEMTRRYRKDHDLMGYEAENLLSNFDTLREGDIWQYRYPEDCDLKSVGVRGIYLGNYVRWDPKDQHEQMIEAYEYNGSKFSRTFDTYDYVDCYNYMDLHDHLKILKHGYSKVLDHACREIRHGRLTRSRGLALVKKYQHRNLVHLEKFCEWLNLKEASLEFLFNHHRSTTYWRELSPGKWNFEGVSTLVDEVESCDPVDNEKISFIANSTLDRDKPSKYIILGKGFP